MIDRNQNSIVMQVTLREGGEDTHVLLGSDVGYESIEQIMQTTRRNGNEDRLRWHSTAPGFAGTPLTAYREPMEALEWTMMSAAGLRTQRLHEPALPWLRAGSGG